MSILDSTLGGAIANMEQTGILPTNLDEIIERAIAADLAVWESNRARRARFNVLVADYRSKRRTLVGAIERKSSMAKLAYYPTYYRAWRALAESGLLARKSTLAVAGEVDWLRLQVEKLG